MRRMAQPGAGARPGSVVLPSCPQIPKWLNGVRFRTPSSFCLLRRESGSLAFLSAFCLSSRLSSSAQVAEQIPQARHTDWDFTADGSCLPGWRLDV